jgi:hypothetical protein
MENAKLTGSGIGPLRCAVSAVKGGLVLLALGTCLCVTVALGGCELLRETRPDGSVGELVHYARTIRTLDDSALAQEYSAVTHRLRHEYPWPGDRIRLALLLSLPSAPFRNDAGARRLLSEALQGEAGAVRDFVSLQLAILDERDDQARAIDRMEQELSGTRAQVNTLREQLEALKAIEKNIEERDEAIEVPQN